MKISIEKLPQGLKLTVTYDSSNKPFVKVLSPTEVEAFISMLRVAMNADGFKFDFQA